jgi:hypothetical protein
MGEHNAASSGYELKLGIHNMISFKSAVPSAVAFALALSFAGVTSAQSAAPAAKPPAKKAAAKPAAAKPVVNMPAAADKEQVAASERVYYGVYDCEFNQTIDITASAKYPAYVDVKHQKSDWLMKPVVSSTGAVRLEDTQGETLMIQIANKSMLLNTKTGHRLVDDCVSPKQREMIAAAKASGGANQSSSLMGGASK